MNRYFLLIIVSLLAVAACGPLTYTIPVEKRAGSADNVDFQGMLPGIVTLAAKGDSDSVLLSSFAIGMAERIETDLELDSGSVPVYSMYAEEVNMNVPDMLDYLHSATGVEFLIVADSLCVGEFSVMMPDEKAYVDGAFLQQTTVNLPYTLRVQVFDSREEGPVDEYSGRDNMQWTLFSDGPLTRLRAVEKVDSELADSFRSLGNTVAARYTPQWETVHKTLYVYNESKWTEACRLAYLFEWEKAMEIWYGEADSPDVRRAACAAHNLSVACEILELNDMAAQWKARSEELMSRR